MRSHHDLGKPKSGESVVGSEAGTHRARTAHPAVLDGSRQVCLVDDPTPAGVDDSHPRLDLQQVLAADEVLGLFRLRQMDGDEVDLWEQILQFHQFHIELPRPIRSDERVVGQHPHPEGLAALCATRVPILPRPMMPIVLPCNSIPRSSSDPIFPR
jgi:hypothetical protein